MPLDRKRPFGEIRPPQNTAAFEQDSKFFNAAGVQVDWKTGELLEGPPEAVATPGNAHDGDTELSGLRELIAKADKMPFAKFRSKAKVALGKEPPASKKDVLVALKAVVARLEAPPAPPPPVPAASANIDLGAWGRGEQQAIFTDVRQKIRDRLHRDVSTKPDAIEALIEAGILDPDRAMKLSD